MSVLLKTTVGEIAARRPQAAALFEALGIDYSCHGNLTLHDACAAAGLDSGQVRRLLQQIQDDERDINWLEQPMKALTAHLGGDLHDAIEHARSLIAARLSDDCAKCEANHETTARLRHEFAVMSQTLDVHFATERRALFPILERLDDCWSRGVAPPSIGVNVPAAIQTLVVEHGRLYDSIETLRTISFELMNRESACLEVIDALRSFDHAVREHVHLANNVLFPRAMALESILTSESSRQPEVNSE